MEGDVSCVEPVEFTVKDTFYIEPGVEGNGDLASRAKKLGIKLKDSLREGVTVCVVGRACSAGTSVGMGGVTGQLRGRRRDRIHRMMAQAQSEPLSTARPGLHGTIVDRANALDSKVVPESTFRRWLAGLEYRGRRNTSRDRGATRSAEVRQGPPQPLIPQLRRFSMGAERRRAQEHPRMVIKDLDGLEPDRIQAFPSELLRKCNLYEDAPPGISPFTPREQWEREQLKLKNRGTKSAGTGKLECRVPSASTTRVRRGGWCECCERAYVGTMSEHCASSKHKASVADDPDFASLLTLVGWRKGQSEPAGTKTLVEVGALFPTLLTDTAEIDEAAGEAKEKSRLAGDGKETPSSEAIELRSGGRLPDQVPLAERAESGACPGAPIATSPGILELPPIRGIAEGTSDDCGKENLPTVLILPQAGLAASGSGSGGHGAEGVTSPCRPQSQRQQTWAHCEGKGGDGCPSPVTPRALQKPLSSRCILVTPSSNGAGCHGSEAVGESGVDPENVQRVATVAPPDEIMHPTTDGAEPDADRIVPDTKQSIVLGDSSENGEAAAGCGAQLFEPPRPEEADEGGAITRKVVFKAQQTQSRLPIVGETPECYRHASGGGELTETPSIPAAQQAEREIVATVTPEDSQCPTEVHRTASTAVSVVVHSNASPARHGSGDPVAAGSGGRAPREKEAPRKKKSRRELDMLADSTGFAEAFARSATSSRPRRGGPRQSSGGTGRQGTAGSRRKTSPGLWSSSCDMVSGGCEEYIEEITSSSGSGSSRRSIRIPSEERSTTEREDEEKTADCLADRTISHDDDCVSDATSSGAIRRKRRRQGPANASRKISPMKGTRSGTLDLESSAGSSRTLERVALTPSRKRDSPLKQDSGGRSPPDVTFNGTAVWQCLAEAGTETAAAFVDSGASGSDGQEGCEPANDAEASVPVTRVVRGESNCFRASAKLRRGGGEGH